jgi:hypothetical protein
MTSPLSTARRSSAQKTRQLLLPEAFSSATIATAALGKGSKQDQRRSKAKALKLAEIALGSHWTAKGGIDSEFEFIGEQPEVDRCYRFAMRTVSVTPEGYVSGARVGNVMHVERAWFDVRGVEVSS